MNCDVLIFVVIYVFKRDIMSVEPFWPIFKPIIFVHNLFLSAELQDSILIQKKSFELMFSNQLLLS